MPNAPREFGMFSTLNKTKKKKKTHCYARRDVVKSLDKDITFTCTRTFNAANKMQIKNDKWRSGKVTKKCLSSLSFACEHERGVRSSNVTNLSVGNGRRISLSKIRAFFFWLYYVGHSVGSQGCQTLGAVKTYGGNFII